MITMTSGNVTKNMLRFALPLLFGNIFQQLYNAVDSIVVGRLVGKEALAAVGSAGAIMNILFFLIVGISLGASVLISQFYGAEDYNSLKKEMGTALVAGGVFTCAIIILSFFSTRKILGLIQTPPEILPLSMQYLRIIIAGLGFTFLYNIFSSALCALGEAKAPICFLVVSSVINAAINIVLIQGFSMGIAGAAWGTVISQAFAALLCFIYIAGRCPLLRLSLGDLRIDKNLLKKTVHFSGTFAVQQSFLYVGVLLVQGFVNTLGVGAIAAYNAATKIDGFALMPGDSLAASLSTFVAQNHGAKQTERVVGSLKNALAIGLCYCIGLSLLLPSIANWAMQLFLDPAEREAISLGASYLKLMALLYPLTAFCNTFQGFYRGLGKMRITLNATLIQIPVRVGFTCALLVRFGLRSVPLATGLGWALMFAYQLLEYGRYKKQKSSQYLV